MRTSGKIPLTKEETWTLPKAEPDTYHEPGGREVELEYKIMSTWTTNDNQFKWHKKKRALTNETQAAMSA